LRLEEEGSPAEIFVHRVTESAGEGYPITELLDNPLFHSLNASEIGELGLFKYGENIYSVDVTSKMKKNTLERVAEYHKENRLSYGISREELRRKITAETPGPLVEFVLDELVKNEELTIYGDRVALPEFEIVFNSQEKDIMERLMKIFLEGKFAPQRVDAVLDEFPDRKKTLQVFNALKEKGMLVRVTETLVFHVSVMEEIIEKTTSHIKENGSINVTDFKGIFGVSRKFAVPVLEYLDRIHVTRRSGDTRILF
jgi:selenocysteine-specific elongation factor